MWLVSEPPRRAGPILWITATRWIAITNMCLASSWVSWARTVRSTEITSSSSRANTQARSLNPFWRSTSACTSPVTIAVLRTRFWREITSTSSISLFARAVEASVQWLRLRLVTMQWRRERDTRVDNKEEEKEVICGRLQCLFDNDTASEVRRSEWNKRAGATDPCVY